MELHEILAEWKEVKQLFKCYGLDVTIPELRIANQPYDEDVNGVNGIKKLVEQVLALKFPDVTIPPIDHETIINTLKQGDARQLIDQLTVHLSSSYSPNPQSQDGLTEFSEDAMLFQLDRQLKMQSLEESINNDAKLYIRNPVKISPHCDDEGNFMDWWDIHPAYYEVSKNKRIAIAVETLLMLVLKKNDLYLTNDISGDSNYKDLCLLYIADTLSKSISPGFDPQKAVVPSYLPITLSFSIRNALVERLDGAGIVRDVLKGQQEPYSWKYLVDSNTRSAIFEKYCEKLKSAFKS